MSFVKVDINTNPIPSGVLEPKPFGYPSGGGGGGGGAVTFNIAQGATILSVDGGSTIPAQAIDSPLLTLPRLYKGNRKGWGLLTIGTSIPGVDPFGGFNRELVGTVSIKLMLATGGIGTLSMGAWAIQNGQVPVIVQKMFDTHNETFNAQVLITNTLKWHKIDAPEEFQDTTIQFNDAVFSIVEF